MSKDLRLVYHCPETGVCKIVIPAPEALKHTSLEDIAKRVVPKGAKYRTVHVDKLPKDREFRDAWTDEKDSDTVDVDLKKAREIHLGRIRKVRNKKLAELDVETLKHIGNPDKLAEVEAKKQELRDLPAKVKKDLDKASTPEALSLVKPL